MTSQNGLLSIEKLTGRDNWCTWSFAVKAYLQLEELWECVQGTEVDTKKDLKAKSKLILLVDPMLYVHIQDANTSKQVWNNLSNAFQDSGLVRKVGLLKDLINTTLESSNSIEEYVNKIMTSAHKLRSINFEIDDEWLGTLMLAGLPDMYKPMIMGIESSGVKISADLIKTKLLQEVKSTSAQDTTTAFYSNFKSKSSSQSVQNKKSKGPRCYNCNGYGHLGKQCWHKKNNKTANDKSKFNNGFVAAFSATLLQDHNNWYVDSGAAKNMTMHRDWLHNIRPSPVKSIRIADNTFLRAECCGDVTIRVPAKDGYNKIQVREVIYVPELATNLLSVSKILKANCKIEFSKGGCTIFNQMGREIARADEIDDTYRLKIYNDTVNAMSAVTEDDTYLWHQRMAHLNFTDVNKIPACTSGVKLSPNQENSICITCIEGKQTRQPFPHNGSRATGLLELVHSDVCGPMQAASFSGCRTATGQRQ